MDLVSNNVRENWFILTSTVLLSFKILIKDEKFTYCDKLSWSKPTCMVFKIFINQLLHLKVGNFPGAIKSLCFRMRRFFSEINGNIWITSCNIYTKYYWKRYLFCKEKNPTQLPYTYIVHLYKLCYPIVIISYVLRCTHKIK